MSKCLKKRVDGRVTNASLLGDPLYACIRDFTLMRSNGMLYFFSVARY